MVEDITVPTDPVKIGTHFNASASFTDPGIVDTHTAIWDWGDGSTSPGTVTEAGGSGSVADSHTYIAVGIYTIKLTVTDDDGDSGDSIFHYVIVYDPTGGFVTGGGGVDSPAGAYAPDPSLTGHTTFGFVAKYQKGAEVPTGQTEFQFQAGDLTFHAGSYAWLVVAGERAIYGGTGTLNGSGNYSFWISVIDGKPDTFRIQIREIIVGTLVIPGPIVYDNELGAAEYAAPTTGLSRGQITIHQTSKGGSVKGQSVSIIGNPPADVLKSLGIQPDDEPANRVFLPLTTR
jgi:hypothetical protein